MRKRRDPTVAVCFRISEKLNQELRLILCDPRTGAPRYGTWGRSLEQALKEWLNSQKVSSS